MYGRKIPFFLVLFFLFSSKDCQLQADVILTSPLSFGETPLVEGNQEEASQFFLPASTFKMILALAAFEQGIATPETTLVCRDAHLPKQPMRLNFQEAMYYSSNDFFVLLMKKLENEVIVEMAQRCGFGKVQGPLPSNKKEWSFGGPIRITPLEEYRFLERLIQGELPLASSLQKKLIEVMRWPSCFPGVEVFAKTGSSKKTYWMVGFAIDTKEPSHYQVITVMLQKPGSDRKQAIHAFKEKLKAHLTLSHSEVKPSKEEKKNPSKSEEEKPNKE